MKLLIDEMWPAAVAVRLRSHGHDAVTVVERPELRGQLDPHIFAAAQLEDRVVVTENVIDFRPLAADAVTHGGSHAGLIYTTNRRFPRQDQRTLGRVVSALDRLLTSGADLRGQEHWLQ